MRLGRKQGRLRTHRKEDDFNPMDGMANLADAMLVFACGLLIAVIANWNVDVTSGGNDQDQSKTKYEIEGVEQDSTETIKEESDMEQMGVVYKDPKTGKYFVVEEK